MLDTNKRKQINLKAFSKLLDLGFVLKKSKIYTTNGEIKSDHFLCEYHSDTRIFRISYCCSLNYLKNLRNQRLIESTSYLIIAKDKPEDWSFDLNQFLRVKKQDKYYSDFDLYNDSVKTGIELKEYEVKIKNYADILFNELLDLILGKTWISARNTRLDGFKITQNGKSEYHNS